MCLAKKKGQKGASKEVKKILVGCLAKSVDSCCKCVKNFFLCVALKISSFKIIQYRCVFLSG
jgi:hypothetical protein